MVKSVECSVQCEQHAAYLEGTMNSVQGGLSLESLNRRHPGGEEGGQVPAGGQRSGSTL